MITFKKAAVSCLGSFLVAGMLHAAACDSFEIKIKNALADAVIVSHIGVDGAHIQPDWIQRIGSQVEQVFTITGSADNVPMKGHMTFLTESLPIKKIKINFDLVNNGLICSHTDNSPKGDYSLETTRIPGKGVNYTILNK